MSALGRHILVELYDCSPDLLNDVVHVEKSMEDSARKAGATIINSSFHHFSPFGVSGVIVIQESHLAIHTWPEYGFASIDLYTCGDTVDPWVSYTFLKTRLRAAHGSAMEMRRGELQLLKKQTFDASPFRDEGSAQAEIKRSRDIWFTERNKDMALSLKHKGKKLYDVQSPFQRIEVYDTLAFGKMLTLDGMVMTTEKDEYVYHEMIAHVPVMLHPNPENVLVIGGGDGGTLRELVKHTEVQSITLVEIDQQVAEASKKLLPAIGSALDHEKVTVLYQDGIQYVHEIGADSFDLVIVDSTDPVGPGEGLFTPDFYRDVYRILNHQGIMVTQSESPRFNDIVFKAIYQCYQAIYGKQRVHCFLAYIPTYPTGMWSFSLCSKADLDPVTDVNTERQQKFLQEHHLKYYNPEIHRAAFALPNFVSSLIKSGLDG
jgi:spermidine synthase